jgi:hypothetical protein
MPLRLDALGCPSGPLAHVGEVAGSSGRLFIGSSTSVVGPALDALGITHLLCISPELPFPSSTSGCYAEWRVPIADEPHAPLHDHFEGAAAFVDAALAAGGRLCAFCADGLSAAPAVVSFYLMRYQRRTLAEALEAVTAASPAAQPNIGFWQRLVEAESWLFGGRAAAATSTVQGGAEEEERGLLHETAPSLSLQQYKWRYLERSLPGATRDGILQQLDLGQAELAALLNVHERAWSAVVVSGPPTSDHASGVTRRCGES